MTIAYKSAGTGVATATSGGALNPTCPAAVDVNDILIAHVTYELLVTAPVLPSGWTELYGPTNLGTGATPTARSWVYGKIADGSEDNATVSFGTPAVTSGRYGRIYSFSGYISGAIDEICVGFNATPSETSIPLPPVRTYETDALAVALLVQDDNNAFAAAGAVTGGTWAEPVAEFVTTLGLQGGVVGIQTATPTANPGLITGGTANATADEGSSIGFSIHDAPPVGLHLVSTATASYWSTTTTPKDTSEILHWRNGDLILAGAAIGSEASTVGVPTATGLTFTQRAFTNSASGSFCDSWIWGATAGSDGSDNITAARTVGASTWGHGASVWRNHDGVGNTAINTSTTKTVSLVRSAADSAALYVGGDFSGSSLAATFTPSGGVMIYSQGDGSALGGHFGFWEDQGAAGTTSYGVTSASTGNFAKCAVEILAVAAPTTTPVTSSIATSWNVEKEITATVAESWKVRQEIVDTVAESWAVKTSLSQSVAESWRVRQAINDTVAQSWNLQGRITQNLAQTWNTRAVITDTVAESWNVRVSLAQSVAESWRVWQAVNQSSAQLWNVGAALTAVTQSVAESWRVRAVITDTVAQSWNLRAQATSSSVQSWHVRQSVTDTTAQSWALKTSLTQSVAESWRVRAAITQSSAQLWAVKTSLTQNVAESWRVRQAVTSTVAEAWNLRAQTISSSAQSWAVKTSLTQSVAESWRIREAVTKSSAQLWNVAGLLTTITKTQATSWKVVGRITSSSAQTWAVKTTLNKTTAESWAVKVAVSKTTAESWRVREAVTKSVAEVWHVRAWTTAASLSSWAVRTSVTQSQATAWNVIAALAGVTKSVAQTWRVRAVTSSAVAEGWNVAARATQSLPETWRVRVPIPASVSTSWRVRGRTTAAQATFWHVVGRITADVALSWRVYPESFYPGGPWSADMAPQDHGATFGLDQSIGFGVEEWTVDLEPATSSGVLAGGWTAEMEA